jgi:Spy/CpxP family protein refolding chaperone
MPSFVQPAQRALRHAELALVPALLLLCGIQDGSATNPPQAPKQSDAKDTPREEQKTKAGLILNSPGAQNGYTLLNPMNAKTTYLIDMDGHVVRTWKSDASSMHAAYLLPNGNLLRVAQLAGEDRAFGAAPGAAGRVQEFSWDGELEWDFKFSNEKQFPHHDVCKLPNGNILFVVWEKVSAADSIAAGRKKELVSNFLLVDSVIEIKPTGKTTGEVVWEWRLMDHLVQDNDPAAANYGDVAAHPELVDFNFVEQPMGPMPGFNPGPGASAKVADSTAKGADPATKSDDARRKEELQKLQTIGYVGTPASRNQRVNPDWTHVNSIDYNAELDQIVLSVHELSEIWIIDHATTTEEARGHTGGKRGKGGDLLYRWGNPRVYRAGDTKSQTLFAQHNAHWIPRGLKGEGHLLIFNNGNRRPGGDHSSVDEIVPPIDENGGYVLDKGRPYGPTGPVWTYSSPKKSDFYAFFISGAHRLPNGNTFVCSGPQGTLFEVTPEGEMVWKYVNPVKGSPGPGFPIGAFAGHGPEAGELVPSMLRDMLALTTDQGAKLDAMQKKVTAAIDQALNEEQRKILREPTGPQQLQPPGQIASLAIQARMKLTPDQRRAISELQKQVDAEITSVLTDDQRKQLDEMKNGLARGFGGGPPGGGPPGGGPPGGGPPGFGPPGFGPPGGPGAGGNPFGPRGFPANAVFRAYRYAANHPALVGKDLAPGKTVEELQPKAPESK